MGVCVDEGCGGREGGREAGFSGERGECVCFFY